MEKLTKLELELMNILWRRNEASVREVQEAIVDRKRPAYTTVQTVLLRLEEKGAVRRTRKIGNAFMFEPAITRKSAYRRLFDDFLELIGGQSQPLVAHLLDSGKLTLDDLKALEDARRGSEKKGTKR